MVNNEKRKVLFNMPIELYDYLKASADEKGIPFTYELLAALNQYKEQREGLKAMKNTIVLKEALEKLSQKLGDS